MLGKHILVFLSHALVKVGEKKKNLNRLERCDTLTELLQHAIAQSELGTMEIQTVGLFW